MACASHFILIELMALALHVHKPTTLIKCMPLLGHCSDPEGHARAYSDFLAKE
jgi:hypothetical protein